MLNYNKICYKVLLIILLFSTNVSLANDKIWKKLSQGGYVVLMRHAPVMKGSANGNPLLRDPSCKKERLLSAKGKVAANILRKRFKQYNIPVSKVFHSPFCRTTDTAKYVFNRGVIAKYLSLLEILGPTESAKQIEKLNQVIGSYAGKGNLILVTHQPNISAISFEQASFLDFIVLKPKGGNQYDEVGIIKFSN